MLLHVFMVLLFVALSQIRANDDSSKSRKDLDGSFNINIGAGYAVGHDQSSNNGPPNGTSNLSFSKSFISNAGNTAVAPNTANLRGPRILTSFTPQDKFPIPEQLGNYRELKSNASDSQIASPSNIHNYNIPSIQSLSDDHLSGLGLSGFQNILNKVENQKPYSKVVQVIKVPAIYEIHLQSDTDNVSQNKVNISPAANLFWKNHYEKQPNITPQYSDDYTKWLNGYYMQREEHFSENGNKYYDFTDTPVVTYENYPEYPSYDAKLNKIVEPIINHHYSHTRPFPKNEDRRKDVLVNYNSELNSKPIWHNKDYPRNRYVVNNFKRHTGHGHASHIQPTYKPIRNENYNFPSTGSKTPDYFKQNLVITDDKPQALHEVPAPFLGRDSHPKPFEVQKSSYSNTYPKLLPTPITFQSHTQAKFNKPAPSVVKPNYNGLYSSRVNSSPGKRNTVLEMETVPSSEHFSSYIKDNQNLIYGKRNKNVLTPYEINIPVTPGTTKVTVTESTGNIGQNAKQSAKYSASIKNGGTSLKFNTPETEDRKYYNYQNYFTDTSKQNNSGFGQELQNHVNGNSNTNTFLTKQSPILDSLSSNVYQSLADKSRLNPNGIDHTAAYSFPQPSSITKPKTINTEAPKVAENKFNNYFEQIVDIPYQTQKSALAENLVSTTPSSNSFSPTVAHFQPSIEHPNQSLHKSNEVNPGQTDNNFGTIGDFSGETKHNAHENLHRRNFNHFSDMMKHGDELGNRDSRYSKMILQRDSKPHLDYVIYITRKASD